ncbi:hypothetical protein [Caballeronia sp. GACF4]|uniref:hypothetical protein n=1 Tax=Caballeronia sp. GACF4 TaxID=2921763 RepID=UPI0020279E4F|nr:hypothetical protein [Caballeronia sp. GACF4]
MSNSLSYLNNLLDRRPNAFWTGELRAVLRSSELKASQIQTQHCTVHFALSQAKRRLESSKRLKKTTFGIESLISDLGQLGEEETLDFYVISTSQYLGTCYVAADRLVGCEFVVKAGTETKPGLWVEGKRIT